MPVCQINTREVGLTVTGGVGNTVSVIGTTTAGLPVAAAGVIVTVPL